MKILPLKDSFNKLRSINASTNNSALLPSSKDLTGLLEKGYKETLQHERNLNT
jgi:hypothetical protein